jgi:hypothetical protein
MKMPKTIKDLPKEIRDEMYKDKVKRNFFKDESQRNLWIRLNAEHIQYSNKKISGIDKPLGEIGQSYSFMQISANQLDYDEHRRDAPRFSFEELVLPHDELLKLERKRNDETVKKMFKETDDLTFNFPCDSWDEDL